MTEDVVKNKPVEKFVVGNVSASVWKNVVQLPDSDDSFNKYSVSVDRSYKDKDGNWASTSVLELGDIPKARIALLEAYKSVGLKDIFS